MTVPAPALSLQGSQAWAHPVYVGENLLSSPSFWRQLLPAGRRLAVVSDRQVEGVLGPLLRDGLEGLTTEPPLWSLIEPGEASKSRGEKARIEDAWLAAGMGRDSVVLALGGGVVGDLAGYCAATYLRGVPVVQVPTSLVAMVDSSLGGKTGIDVPAGKNLIGAFHPPLAVVADVVALRTLPDAELRHGMAEVVKHGIIADRMLLDWLDTEWPAVLARDMAACAKLVRRNLAIKAHVVQSDEREGGLRQALNMGHTLGHAFELLADYALPHGAAVALGIVAELRLAERLRGFDPADSARIRALLERIGLPVRLHDVDWTPAQVLAATRSDKKTRAGVVRYALPDRLGSLSADPAEGYAIPVPDEWVLEALAEVLPAA